jgi:hypothetical protein
VPSPKLSTPDLPYPPTMTSSFIPMAEVIAGSGHSGGELEVGAQRDERSTSKQLAGCLSE